MSYQYEVLLAGMTAINSDVFFSGNLKKFTGASLQFYLFLVSRIDVNSTVVISMQTIEEETGWSTHTIRKYSEVLSDLGLISVTKKPAENGRWPYNVYTIMPFSQCKLDHVDRGRKSPMAATANGLSDASTVGASGGENLPLIRENREEILIDTLLITTGKNLETGTETNPTGWASPVDALRKLGLDYSKTTKSAGSDSAVSRPKSTPAGNGKNSHSKYLEKKQQERWSEFNANDLCYLFADGFLKTYGKPYVVNLKSESIQMKKLIESVGPEEAVDLVVALFKHHASFETAAYPTVSPKCFAWGVNKLQQLRIKKGETLAQQPKAAVLERDRQRQQAKIKEWDSV